MNNINKAKELLCGSDYTCVLVNGDSVLTSRERGVKPLLNFIDSGKDLSSFAAADKIVGKGAALLYLCLGIKQLYADVISKPAFDVLTKNGVSVQYGTLAEMIINRNGDGACPMEIAVADTDDPMEGLELIKEKLIELRKH